MIISRSIHVAANGMILFFFMSLYFNFHFQVDEIEKAKLKKSSFMNTLLSSALKKFLLNFTKNVLLCTFYCQLTSVS